MSKLDRSLVSAELLVKIAAWSAPIFMVDRIADYVSGEKPRITVVKHVTFNEPYIAGHFPGFPVMPGVMVSEILGQASEYLSLLEDFVRAYQQKTEQTLKKFDDVMQALKSPEGESIIVAERERLAGFLAAQDVKYKHVMYPGDTIYVESTLMFSDMNGFHHYDVEARVGRQVTCSGRIVTYRAEREKLRSRA